MARFGFVGPSYRSQSLEADGQTCMNWYPEADESQMGKSAVVLYPTPGLQLLYNLGTSGVRALITAQGRTFAVAGTILWELLPPTASPNKINRGSVLSDGQTVSIIGGGHQVLLASAGTAYVFDLNTNTLTAIPFATFGAPIVQVAYSDGFFFALVANLPPALWQIRASALFDATSWDPLAVTSVSVFSDNPNAIFCASRLLWVFGPKAIQPYYNSGNFPFPFDVIQGTFIENGLAAPFSVAKLDNSLFWLGSDERGNGMVWRANGFTPQRISNHALEYALQSYGTIADAFAYAYQDQGHSFYVLSFPSADKTWVFDAATQMWHERGFWNVQASVFTRHRAAFHTFNFGRHIVGDPTTGAVYRMAIDIYSDFEHPIRRVRRAPHICKEQQWIFHKELMVDLEVALGPVPPYQVANPPTFFYLADISSAVWKVGVNDLGILVVSAGGLGTPAPLFINDPWTATSWQIVVDTFGILSPVSVPFSPTYPGALPMTSILATTRWDLDVRQVSGTIGVIRTSPLGVVTGGPTAMLRWSNDGGKTWSQEHARDCGQAGMYRTRVIWRRLGRSRDRIYELSVTDAVPWRIIDAYLQTNEYVPLERATKEMAQRA